MDGRKCHFSPSDLPSGCCEHLAGKFWHRGEVQSGVSCRHHLLLRSLNNGLTVGTSCIVLPQSPQ